MFGWNKHLQHIAMLMIATETFCMLITIDNLILINVQITDENYAI